MQAKSFFSLLLPTRDRPEMIKLVLTSLSMQTFINFEVILSDNYISDSCHDIYLSFKDKLNIQYFKPAIPLAMHDNYTYALSNATGNYVIALEDKYALLPFALQDLYNIITNNNYEIINFQFDTYVPNHDNFELGTWTPGYNIYPNEVFKPLKAIQKNLNFRFSHLNPPVKEKIRNKILIGCWSKKLIDRIQRHCPIFQPLSCDYTSMVLGSIYTKSNAYDFGRSLGIAISHDQYSNGYSCLYYYKISKNYIENCNIDEELSQYCLLDKNCFVFPVSLAYDYNRIIHKNNYDKILKVNLKNLCIRALEQLDVYLDMPESEKQHLRSLIPKPALWELLLDKIRNYIYVHYNPFYILLYLKINILGRLNNRKYKTILDHRNFCKSYKHNVEKFSDILNHAHKHYITFSKQ